MKLVSYQLAKGHGENALGRVGSWLNAITVSSTDGVTTDIVESSAKAMVHVE